MMKLIVGLGNPEKQYMRTRHNAGWRALEYCQRMWSHEYDFSEWKHVKKYNAQLSEGVMHGEKIILMLPETFMNRSGNAVGAWVRQYKLLVHDLIVVHDEIDLPLGGIRISVNASAAGHRGVQSIIDVLGKKTFTRLRIGIASEAKGKKATEVFVLERFTKEEENILAPIWQKCTDALSTLVEHGCEEAKKKFH